MGRRRVDAVCVALLAHGVGVDVCMGRRTALLAHGATG